MKPDEADVRWLLEKTDEARAAGDLAEVARRLTEAICALDRMRTEVLLEAALAPRSTT